MPLTSKDRVARFRARLKTDPERYQLHLEKERERDRKRRYESNKVFVSTTTAAARKKVEKKRQQQRERQALCRLRKSRGRNQENAKGQEPFISYKSPQALGKALARAKKSLPLSPRKRRTVLMHLAKDIGQKPQTSQSSHSSALPISTQTMVHEFYKSDDISWQAPGRKDFVQVSAHGQPKQSEQKKIMLMTIDEALEIFKTEHPDIKIGRSCFFKLRPGNVVSSSNMPHNVCVCRYHSNMEMALKAASQMYEGIPNNFKEFCKRFVCTTDHEECMTGKCENCRNKAKISIGKGISEETLSEKIEWQKWADVEGHMKIVVETGSMEDLLEYILEQLPSFKVHCFVKNMQQKYFQESRNSIMQTEAVLQVDFAENYSAKVQDELQMLHWMHQQVTIFTAVAWVQSGHYSFAIISDDLTHGKHSVWVFLKHLSMKLLELQPSIKHVKIFSDGCAAQFKNKFTLSNLTFMHDDYGITGEWSFFASSHGKGAVDGVGGVVKRTVWNAVRTRKFVVTNAPEFAECANQKLKNINVIFVPATEIEQCRPALDERWKTLNPIPGTQSLHYFRPIAHYVLEVKSVSLSKNSATVRVSGKTETCSSNHKPVQEPMQQEDSYHEVINRGDFVDVFLMKESGKGKEKYRAQVTDIDSDSLELKYLKKKGKVWVYSDDMSWENQHQVLCKLPQPRMLNSRGNMSFK